MQKSCGIIKFGGNCEYGRVWAEYNGSGEFKFIRGVQCAHRELIKLDATIGTNKLVGLLDTGATSCFMYEQVAKRSQIVFSSDNVGELPDVGTFSNVTCKALGVAKNVIVDVFTSSTKMDFIVIDCKLFFNGIIFFRP